MIARMDTPFIHGRLALADASELIERYRRRCRLRGRGARRAEPRRRQCRAFLPLAADRAGDRHAEQRRGPRHGPLSSPICQRRSGAAAKRRERAFILAPFRSRWLRLVADERAGFKARAARLLARPRFSLRRRSGVRPDRPSRRHRRRPPSSIPSRRSLRCPTSASMAGPRTPGRGPAAGGPPAPQAVQAHPTDETGELRYTVAVEGLDVVGDVEELLKAFRAAVGARGRPQGPGQRGADRPPLARRRRPARRTAAKPGLL